MMLYVFSDIMIKASHERINTFSGRASQGVKDMFGSILQQPERVLKTTVEDGVETVHKLKFLRMEELNVMSVSEFPADKNLEFGFVIHFPDRPAYFKAPSAAVRASFLMHFAAACADLDDTHNQRREALKRVHGT